MEAEIPIIVPSLFNLSPCLKFQLTRTLFSHKSQIHSISIFMCTLFMQVEKVRLTLFFKDQLVLLMPIHYIYLCVQIARK